MTKGTPLLATEHGQRQRGLRRTSTWSASSRTPSSPRSGASNTPNATSPRCSRPAFSRSRAAVDVAALGLGRGLLGLLELSLEELDARRHLVDARLQARGGLAQDPADPLDLLHRRRAGDGLDAPHAGLHRAFREDHERADVAGRATRACRRTVPSTSRRRRATRTSGRTSRRTWRRRRATWPRRCPRPSSRRRRWHRRAAFTRASTRSSSSGVTPFGCEMSKRRRSGPT